MTAPLPSGNRWRPSRRSSFARRDSNLALLGAVLAGAIIAFALLLLLIQKANPEAGARIRGAAADVLQPVAGLLALPVRGVTWVGGRVGEHFRVVAENRALRAELETARAEAARSAALAEDVRRLEALLAVRNPPRRLVASGRASAQAGSAAGRTAIISVGWRDGARPGMPVIAADGLAGRVTDVGLHAARVQLLTDPSSRVPAMVLRTGWTGLAVGRGTTIMEFQFDPASGADRIRRGDRLVTSGDGGLFPPGLPVAIVIDAEVSPPLLRPAANPAGLGPVRVEAPWLPPPPLVPAAPADPEADLPPPAAPEAAATEAPPQP